MSFARLLVADRYGYLLDELSANIEFVNWRLNNVGKVKFAIGANDSKATRANLGFGNRIFIEFDNGLPDWGGVIDPPRTWQDGLLTIEAYSGEYLLRHRTTDKSRYFTTQSAGAIFESLITEANVVEDTGIQMGSIYMGGTDHSPDYHYKDLLQIVQESITGRLSNFEFDVVPSIVDGQIQFTANFYEMRGSTKLGILLIEGSNAANIVLREQGPIINSWDAAGEGSGWGDDRLTSNAQDLESIAAYGLREGSNVYSDVSLQATLDGHVATSLANSKDPKNVFSMSSLDVDPAGFEDYIVGDVVSFIAPSFGFDGTDTSIRIMAREFSPGDGVCTLVVEEQI